MRRTPYEHVQPHVWRLVKGPTRLAYCKHGTEDAVIDSVNWGLAVFVPSALFKSSHHSTLVHLLNEEVQRVQ